MSSMESKVATGQTESPIVAQNNKSSSSSATSAVVIEQVCLKDASETQPTPRPITSITLSILSYITITLSATISRNRNIPNS